MARTQPRATRANRSRSAPAEVPRISKLVHTQDQAGRERREIHFARPAARGGVPDSAPRGSQGNAGGSGVPSYSQVRGQANQVSSATPKLAAEWLVCVIIIGATTLTKEGEYGAKMAETLWQVGKGGVKNRGRDSTRPTQVDRRMVAA